MRFSIAMLGKRPRESGGDGPPPPQAPVDTHAPPFRFGFGADDAQTATAPAPADDPPSAAVRPASTTAVVVDDFVDAVTGFSVARGDAVAVDWAASTDFRLAVRVLATGADRVQTSSRTGRVPPSVVRLCAGTRIAGTVSTPALLHHDAVWAPGSAVGGPHDLSPVPSPLLLEPGLAAFAWPLTPAAFRSNVWERGRVFVCHATGARLAELAPTLDSFDVQRMLRSASRLVVWMRGAGGRMHFLDASPDVAAAAYDAGHSLYFNPPEDVQRRLVDGIAGDLRVGTRGGRWAPPPQPDAGDVEVFAVRGRHTTPWHYDAQANFTVQVRGTKVWSLLLRGAAPSGGSADARSAGGVPPPPALATAGAIVEPYSNLHPSSSNEDVLLADAALHALCAAHGGGGLGAAAAAEPTHVVQVAMRPGSVLYLPAGTWHAVEADDDGAGSLSINVSVSGGARWADVLLRRLAPALWADPALRGRVGAPPMAASGGDAPTAAAAAAGTRAGVRAACAAAIARLAAAVAALTPDDVLPPGLLEEGAGAGAAGDEDDDEDADDADEEDEEQARAAGAAARAMDGDGASGAAAMPTYVFTAVRGGGGGGGGAPGGAIQTPRDTATLDAALIRSPLAALIEWPPGGGGGDTGADATSFRVVAGFGGVDGAVGRPDVRVRVDVAGRVLVRAVRRLCTAAPGGAPAPLLRAALDASVRERDNASEIGRSAGDSEVLLARLGRLLVRVGFFRRACKSSPSNGPGSLKH